MAREPGRQAIYDIAEQFRQRCLFGGASLLWPDTHSWTSGNIEAFRRAVLESQADDDGSFLEKLERRLEGLPEDLRRISADVTTLYYIYPFDTNSGTKERNIRFMAGSSLDVSIDPTVWKQVSEACLVGVGNLGQHRSAMPAYYRLVLELALACRAEHVPTDDDDGLVRIASEVSRSLPRSLWARHAVLHLLVPDRFEGTVSEDQRSRILAAFSHEAGDFEDPDEALLAIRNALRLRFDRDHIDFYDEDIRPLWDAGYNADPDVAMIRAFVEKEIADKVTRTALLAAIAEAITHAHSISNSSWALTFPVPNELRMIVSNLRTLAIAKSAFWIFIETEQFRSRFPDDAALADEGISLSRDPGTTVGLGVPYARAVEWLDRLKSLNDQLVGDSAASVKRRSHRHEHHQPAAVTYLNEELGMDLPQPAYVANVPKRSVRWWIERTSTVGWPYRQAGEWSVGHAVFYWPNKIAKGHVQSKMQEGDVILHLTDQMGITGISRVQSAWREEISTPDGTDWNLDKVAVTRLRDYRQISPPLKREDFFGREPFAGQLKRLPAQGCRNLFYTTKGGLELWGSGYLTPVPRVLLDILRAAYLASANEELVPEGWPMPEGPCDDPIKVLIDRTHMPEADLLELIDLIEDKKQLILEGPPGSGKTYLADLLARWIAGVPLEGDDTDGRVELVQFHQSYGYEDFVQGLRPVSRDGQVVFEVVDGIFLRMCTRAAADPDNEYVLIIDEINRGNLSRIFGELLMALEYRDKPVRLPYGDMPLRIPGNLSLIGTMNSTDRSLALIDYALRRRFYFHRLLPVSDGNAPVYRRWLEARVPGAHHSRLHTLFVNLNTRIGERLTPDFQVGHSYFMRGDIHTDAGLNRVWKHAVTPLLQEYFHTTRNAADVLSEFTIDRLLGRQAQVQEPGAAAGTGDDGQP